MTTVDLGHTTARSYWDNEVGMASTRFASSKTRENALEWAKGLWHIHEWIAKEECVRKDAFQKQEIAKCPELGLLRDIVEGTKHPDLGRADVRVKRVSGGGERGTAYLTTPFGTTVKPGGSPIEVRLTDDTTVPLQSILDAVSKHWKTTRFTP